MTHFNWSVQLLGSTSSATIGQVMELPPSFPGKFLEICQRCFLSQSKALDASAPVPLPATAKPAVLGRCGFREGLGRSGQKIRRRLAPPRPPSPSPSSFQPASSRICQSVARAPRDLDLRALDTHWLPSASVLPSPDSRAAVASGTWSFAYRGKRSSLPAHAPCGKHGRSQASS